MVQAKKKQYCENLHNKAYCGNNISCSCGTWLLLSINHKQHNKQARSKEVNKEG